MFGSCEGDQTLAGEIGGISKPQAVEARSQANRSTSVALSIQKNECEISCAGMIA